MCSFKFVVNNISVLRCRSVEVKIQISMDGRGRALDNIFIERLWRTVKYEYVYLQDWSTLQDARSGLAYFFDRYNHRRLHQSLGYQTPASVYFRARAAA